MAVYGGNDGTLQKVDVVLCPRYTAKMTAKIGADARHSVEIVEEPRFLGAKSWTQLSRRKHLPEEMHT